MTKSQDLTRETTMNYSRITQCRVCGNTELVEVVNLGTLALTGVFPESETVALPEMPLILVKCHGIDGCCHLLQLAHTYDQGQMFGENYGYRSGLNKHMEEHLEQKVKEIMAVVTLSEEDLVLDIGSNDGTTLSFYPNHIETLVGIDPTAQKFARFCPAGIRQVADFFSKAVYTQHYGARKAKVVTSFSMFYDLCNPVQFAMEVASILDEQGIWVLEQSYMPAMLQSLSYDTVCHEHLEYYGLQQIKWIMDKANLDIIDVSFNKINGGSFSVTVAHFGFQGEKHYSKIDKVMTEELQYKELLPFRQFAQQIQHARKELLTRLQEYKREGKVVAAIGASTKGNVVLQYCGIDASLVNIVGEVNEDKFGKFTPGTHIPIKPESEVLQQRPDYLLVLPWHLKSFFEENELFSDCEFIYPINNSLCIEQLD